MARIDPNQAAAAATGLPIPGADPLGQPIIDLQNPAPTGAYTPSAEDIATAESLGLNPHAMGPDEWEFVQVFNTGGLDSLAPDADPENPLIPGEGAPVTTPLVPTTQPTADAPPPAPGADSRVGPATTPDGTIVPVTDDGSGGATSTTAPESIATPGRPAFEIPNPIPPAPAPPEPTAPQLQPGLVALPDGSLVTLETYNAIVAAQQQQQPFAQQQPQPWNGPNPQAPPVPPTPQQHPLGYQPPVQPQPGFVPNAWAPTPGEYVDERAAYEIERMRAEQAQLQQALQQTQLQTAAALEAHQANSRQAIDVAVEETLHGYAGARGLTYEQADDLLKDATRLGIVGVYSQQFPGDPRRAVAAAIENMYNNTPEYRQLELQRQMEAERESNAEVERKKAFAGQTTGTPGSVPRAAAPAGTQAEANAGIVALIEADPAFQAQQAQRRSR